MRAAVVASARRGAARSAWFGSSHMRSTSTTTTTETTAAPKKAERYPLLLTPGPLTTTAATKEACLKDFGSRDDQFMKINTQFRERLLNIINGENEFVCVPLQGSGTFAVEAMLGTLVPPDATLLLLINGQYGERMLRICAKNGRTAIPLRTPENTQVSPTKLNAVLNGDRSITHVAVVYCETTTGILNPLKDIAEVVELHKRSLLVDAMSAFGALPLDSRKVRFDAVAASSNKCLEGLPGMGYVLARKTVLDRCEKNSPSLSLDLYDQWKNMEKTRQWRFTPPTQIIAAFNKALDQFYEQGAQRGRHTRYRKNWEILVTGMRKFGFQTYLEDRVMAPIIVTFMIPPDPKFQFQKFYEGLRERGFVIYPGKLTNADTFRVGCIGDLHPQDMNNFLQVAEEVLTGMGVTLPIQN